jgi:hypothetical protein
MRVGEPEAFERREVWLDASQISVEPLGALFRPARAARRGLTGGTARPPSR